MCMKRYGIFLLLLLQACAPATDLSSKQFPKSYSMEGPVPQEKPLCMVGYKAVWVGTQFIYVPDPNNQCKPWIPEKRPLNNQIKE